jgi:flagellar M-ring protein FliF
MAEEQKVEPKKNLIATIKSWPRARQLSLAGVTLLCLLFFTLIIIKARQTDYQLLFGNLDSGDAAAIVARLKEQKIAYRLENGGKAVYIPAEKVHETRLELAGSGLPQGGGVGFEIFDKQSFGMTDFAQKINYQRALQGELARTIASLEPVEAARVHLVLPERRLFREQQKNATASVIVKMTPGSRLNSGQIQGIVNLVAGSVEGLENALVTVIDSAGQVLSSPPTQQADGTVSPSMLEYQQSVEKRLQSRAQLLLDRALGQGNSLVQVTAAVDFSQRERLEESYDPNATAVRSEQTSSEKGGIPSAGGVPGVAANTGEAGNSGFVPTSRSNETVNYEVSKVVSKLVEPVGAVRSLSVAVLVKDLLVPGKDDQADSYQPRKPEELAAIEKMVKSALGLNAERGDQIVVISRPFESTPIGADDFVRSPQPGYYRYLPLIKYALLFLAAVLVYFLLVRPMLKTLRNDEPAMVEHYKTVEQLEAELSGEEPLQLPGPDDPTERLRKEILQSPAAPIQIIKSWLKEDV